MLNVILDDISSNRGNLYDQTFPHIYSYIPLTEYVSHIKGITYSSIIIYGIGIVLLLMADPYAWLDLGCGEQHIDGC